VRRWNEGELQVPEDHQIADCIPSFVLFSALLVIATCYSSFPTLRWTASLWASTRVTPKRSSTPVLAPRRSHVSSLTRPLARSSPSASRRPGAVSPAPPPRAAGFALSATRRCQQRLYPQPGAPWRSAGRARKGPSTAHWELARSSTSRCPSDGCPLPRQRRLPRCRRGHRLAPPTLVALTDPCGSFWATRSRGAAPAPIPTHPQQSLRRFLSPYLLSPWPHPPLRGPSFPTRRRRPPSSQRFTASPARRARASKSPSCKPPFRPRSRHSTGVPRPCPSAGLCCRRAGSSVSSRSRHLAGCAPPAGSRTSRTARHGGGRSKCGIGWLRRGAMRWRASGVWRRRQPPRQPPRRLLQRAKTRTKGQLGEAKAVLTWRGTRRRRLMRPLWRGGTKRRVGGGEEPTLRWHMADGAATAPRSTDEGWDVLPRGV